MLEKKRQNTHFFTSLPLLLWTVENYHCMAEAGILLPDEKVELIDRKVIRKMSPQRSYHAAAITCINQLLSLILGDNVLIRLQLSIRLNN